MPKDASNIFIISSLLILQERNVYMTDMKQKIPQISDWCQFLGNYQNKTADYWTCRSIQN